MHQGPSPPYEPSTGVPPLSSPEHEDIPTWNILPSYQLYQSTFSKNILLSNDDLTFEPPDYEDDANTRQGIPGYFDGVTVENAGSSLPRSSSPLVSTLPTRWENSIHGNTHKLKRLTSSSSCSNLKISIVLTHGPGEPGKLPLDVIDPKKIEFKQGDTVNGYVTITNTSSKPIPFSMFFVVFEGKVSVRKPGGSDINDPKYALIYYKFMNMFDYNASWTPAQLDSTLNGMNIDPLDRSVLRFPLNGKLFEPLVTYKKYFSFKIPERLLDAACEEHNLQLHCEIQPSIGLPREQFLIELRKLRRNSPASRRGDNSLTGKRNNIDSYMVSGDVGNTQGGSGLNDVLRSSIKDISFPDTAISYSVEARVIGKASSYPEVFNTKKFESIEDDEFIIVDEESCFVRIVPKRRINLEEDRNQILKESKLVFEDLVKRVKEIVNLGRNLQAGEPISRPPSCELIKRPQLYTGKSESSLALASSSSLESCYRLSTNCTKKLLSSSKFLGEFICQTPKLKYVIPYVIPRQYTHKNSSVKQFGGTGINIPLEFIFKGIKPPEIKLFSVDLIAFTYRSKKYPVPIEIYHDLIFKNKPLSKIQSFDNFDYYVVEPFQKYLDELIQLTKQFGSEVLQIDKKLIMDIKSLANLQTKFNTVKVEQARLSPTKWVTVNTGELNLLKVRTIFLLI